MVDVSLQEEGVPTAIFVLDARDDGVETEVGTCLNRSRQSAGRLEVDLDGHRLAVHMLHMQEELMGRRAVGNLVPVGGHTSAFLSRHKPWLWVLLPAVRPTTSLLYGSFFYYNILFDINQYNVYTFI